MNITRRAALTSGLLGSLAACETSRGSLPRATAATFPQGVASGDPQIGSVVLWTRAEAEGPVAGIVEVSDGPDFTTPTKTMPFETGPARDHTVKVVAGATPGRDLYYRFRVGDSVSPVGRTRCLPDRCEHARFAVVSCSNYPFGYFNAYDAIARGGFDAVIHLGDYLYEYGPDGYGGEVGASLDRQHRPPREVISLADYRERHRQYKSDPASQDMHASAPVIAIWDDHETANNSWERGAENHQPDEGAWDDRKRAALQAYHEYMPVRDPVPGRPREALWRSYDWGGLAELCAIETRLTARSEQFDYEAVLPELTSPEAVLRWRRETLGSQAREMMGAAQLAYVEDALRGSVRRGTPWRLVANQVIMARVTAPDLASALDEEAIARIEGEWPPIRAFVEFTKLGLPLNVDAWDGYPAARERFMRMAAQAGARDLLVLTGDTHESWVNALHDDTGTPMGVELGVTSVTSPGPTTYLRDQATDYSALLRQKNPEILWHDVGQHGFIDLELTPDRGRADHVSVSTVAERSYETLSRASFALSREGGTIRLAQA